jgi:hypothetical protein
VQRTRWFVPTTLVPTRAPGEADADFLLRLLGWLRGRGLPTACFVRAWGDDLRGDRAKSRKPLYIDFASLFLVGLFEREVRASTLVLFDEALPAPADAPCPPGAPPRVTELVIEISDARGDAG